MQLSVGILLRSWRAQGLDALGCTLPPEFLDFREQLGAFKDLFHGGVDEARGSPSDVQGDALEARSEDVYSGFFFAVIPELLLVPAVTRPEINALRFLRAQSFNGLHG